MIEIIPFDESNIVGMRVDGEISDQGLRLVIEVFDAALESGDRVRIYAEIERIGGMSVDTFIERIKTRFRYFQQRDSFEKAAIVSDKSWHQAWIKTADTIFSGFEVRYFSTDEKDLALAWVKA